MSIMTYRQALHDTLRAEMLRDDDVFLIGEEIGIFEGSYKITAGMLKEFGEKRVRELRSLKRASPGLRSAPRCSGCVPSSRS